MIRSGDEAMVTIKRILLPTDYSDLAAHAARHAQFLAKAHNAEIHVLHVVAPSRAAGISPVAADVGVVPLLPDTDTLIEAQKPRIRRFVEDFVRTAGVNVITEVRVGVPHNTIAEYAREAKIDLVVIGSHARGIVKRIFLGSTSKAVLESAPCPVLMVPVVTMPEITPSTSGNITSAG